MSEEKSSSKKKNCIGQDFSLKKIIEGVFTDCILTNAKFMYADLTVSNFSGNKNKNEYLDIRNADFYNAILLMTNFDYADLSGAQLIETTLTYASFLNARLIGADCDSADLSGAIFCDADCRGINITNACFNEKNNFKGTNFKGAKGAITADFRGTIFEGYEDLVNCVTGDTRSTFLELLKRFNNLYKYIVNLNLLQFISDFVEVNEKTKTTFSSLHNDFLEYFKQGKVALTDEEDIKLVRFFAFIGNYHKYNDDNQIEEKSQVQNENEQKENTQGVNVLTRPSSRDGIVAKQLPEEVKETPPSASLR